MTAYSIDSLNQKFELRSYTVIFDIADSLAAEELLDSLDRATANFKQVFNIQEEPQASFYLLKNETELEKATGLAAKVGENIRKVYENNTVFLVLDKFEEGFGEVAVRELGHLYFNNKVNEKEIRVRQWRSPSWLREGFALQSAYKIRKDSREWLQKGWAKLQEAQKANQLIKPGIMIKDINLIPDAARRQLALFQSFYMVRLLLGIYCDSFFSKYSTLMGALEDMEAENCFRQITSFDFEKFFSLFDDWVKKTNAWTAME
ncbi:MAG: hypothetical protein PWR01_3436 [Clostridiales bacterium]|jgi:hypothetical protein|nr:hypothetical protein [Clostridiales bacterium]MDN5282363.1 hypothetical protein [Candidatus Ozemobacter sp.]